MHLSSLEFPPFLEDSSALKYELFGYPTNKLWIVKVWSTSVPITNLEPWVLHLWCMSRNTFLTVIQLRSWYHFLEVTCLDGSCIVNGWLFNPCPYMFLLCLFGIDHVDFLLVAGGGCYYSTISAITKNKKCWQSHRQLCLLPWVCHYFHMHLSLFEKWSSNNLQLCLLVLTLFPLMVVSVLLYSNRDQFKLTTTYPSQNRNSLWTLAFSYRNFSNIVPSLEVL